MMHRKDDWPKELAAFIEEQQLSNDDIAELKQILDKKGGN